MDNDVQQRVLKIICEVLDIQNCEEARIKLDASLRDDLEFDSLSQITLLIALEDEFDRTIPPEQIMELTTVKEIIDFINEKLQESSST